MGFGALLSAIGELFSVITAIFGHATHRSELNNAADVKAMESNRDEESARDREAKAIKNEDTKEIQRLLG